MPIVNALNTGAKITLGGSLLTNGDVTFVGAFATVFTATASTSVTFPTSGTLATVSQIPSLPVSAVNGGTSFSTYALGDTIYASATNVLSKLSGNITTAKQYLSQTGTGTVSAAPAWASIAGADVTGAALTGVNDTNVTLTLGGTPATSLLRAASLTLGWTGTLARTRGGTGVASAFQSAQYQASSTQAISSNASQTVIAANVVSNTFGSNLTYSAGTFTNASGGTLNLLVSYSLRYVSVPQNTDCNAWIVINNTGIFYGQAISYQPNVVAMDVALTGTAVIQLTNTSTFAIQTFQVNTGSASVNISTGTAFNGTVITIYQLP